MSGVRFEFPKLRLATQLAEAGGITVAAAVKAANANLEQIKPECLTELQRAANEILTVVNGLPPEFAAEPLQALYSVASRSVGLGAVCDAPGADVALVSLCDLLDRLVAAERLNRPAIGVHVQTLQLLAFNIGGANNEHMTAKVLAGLKQVSDRHTGEDVARRAATA